MALINTTAILLTALCLAIISVLAESNSCQCNLRRPGYGGRICSDKTTAPNNAPDAQEYKKHNERGLFGDCLPEVEAKYVIKKFILNIFMIYFFFAVLSNASNGKQGLAAKALISANTEQRA